jgi:hypothetical protein
MEIDATIAQVLHFPNWLMYHICSFANLNCYKQKGMKWISLILCFLTPVCLASICSRTKVSILTKNFLSTKNHYNTGIKFLSIKGHIFVKGKIIKRC